MAGTVGIPRGWLAVDPTALATYAVQASYTSITGLTGSTIYFITRLAIWNDGANDCLVRFGTAGVGFPCLANAVTEIPLADQTGVRIDTDTPIQAIQDGGATSIRVGWSGITLSL